MRGIKDRSSKALADTIRHLGYALHIAQDRGAHWEGAKNMGHDNPKEKTWAYKWSTDLKKDNYRGYQNAGKYTGDVFTRFVSLTRRALPRAVIRVRPPASKR